MYECAVRIRGLQPILAPIQRRDVWRGKGDEEDDGEVGRCDGMMGSCFVELACASNRWVRAKVDNKIL